MAVANGLPVEKASGAALDMGCEIAGEPVGVGGIEIGAAAIDTALGIGGKASAGGVSTRGKGGQTGFLRQSLVRRLFLVADSTATRLPIRIRFAGTGRA